MNTLEKNLLKLLNNLKDSKQLLEQMKVAAYNQLIDGYLSPSEHCDIEAWIDNKLMEK